MRLGNDTGTMPVPWVARVAACLLSYLDLVARGRIRDQGETEEGEGERTRDADSLLDSLSEPPEAEGKENERLSPSEVGVSEPLAGVVACSPAPSVSHDPAPTHVRQVEDSETTGNRNERRNKDDERMIFGSPSFVSPASRSLSHADHLAAAGMCMKALQFVRVYVSQVAGGAAPGILRSRPKKEAKGPKARKKRETEDAKLADTKANVQCGAGDTDACVKGDKTDADEACGEEAKNDERVEGRQTHSTEISVEAYATSRGEAVMPAKERFACLERRRSSGGKGRACGRSEMETKAGAPRTSTALGVKREGPADPQKPRQTHPFFQRRGQCKAPVTSEASIGRIPNHEDCSDISADFCIPQKRPNEVAGIREPSRSCSRSFPPTDGASSAWTADVSFSPLASLGLLRQGLGGDMLDNFLHFWSALDLQAIAFVALQLGCPVDALIFAEQELERRCPDSGLEEGLAVVSQQWQRAQWDRMPQIRSVQVLRQMLLEAQRGQGRGPDEVPRPPRAVANAAPDQEEASGGKGGAAEGGTDEQGTWEKTEGVAEGAGRALDCGHVVPGDKGKGEEGTVGSDGNRPSKEQRMSPESMRHFQLSLQRLREMAIRPANASALLTPVGPAPLFLLVSQALINANEEDLSAVTDCLSAWHTSNFLIQRMHAENDWLATLTLQQEQLETLEAKRLQVLAQLRQLHSTGLHGHPDQAAWSASSIGLEARSVFENEAVGRSRITQTGDRDLHTRLREVEEELYATKLQMADALGAIGLHSLRESLLVSLSLSSSVPSQLSHSPSYPSLACTLSSQRSPMDFGGSWSGPGGGALGGLGTRPFSASIGVGFPPLLEDEGKETDCGATAWLEKKFECLWRLHRWDCDETPWGASQTERCPMFDSNADLTESFSPCPRRPRDQTQPSLSLFNGCIYATLSLIHGAASCHPSSLVCPLQSSQACSNGARAPHSATWHQQKSLFSTPEDVIVDAGADAGNGDQVDGEAEEALIFQRGLSSTMARLRAVQTSRHALALALERLARSPQLADSSLPSIGHSAVDAQDQSLSRRLLGAYVELSMAHALQRATTLNLLLNQCEQDWNDDPCGAASFEHLQSSWANDLAVTAGAASACSSSASSSSLSSLPFFLEPLVSLETCILQAAIPSFHCIPPSAPFLPRSFETWTLRDASGAAACMRERQEDTLRFQRCCGDRGEALTDAHACGCHVRRPAARHLLLLSQMKRERGDWRGSLENLLQAKEHLLQLQRDRERPFWEAVPVRSTERLG
ncbi:FATC domain-containing protein, partial [Toxoplasma gondii MAS]